jgi:hypothetical protein
MQSSGTELLSYITECDCWKFVSKFLGWWRAEGEISGVLCVRIAVTFSHIPIAYMVAGVSNFFVEILDCAARLLSVA